MITKVKPGECHCVNCCNERKAIIEAKRRKASDKKYEAEAKKVTFEINIGGKVRNLHFGRIAVEVWTKNIKQDALESSFAYAIIFGGLYEYNFRKEIREDLSLKDVVQWVDKLNETNAGKKDLKRICQGFLKCPQYKAFIKQIEEKKY